MKLLAFLLLSCASLPAQHSHGYRDKDGNWVRPPHVYKRHPNTGTVTTAVCRDGSTSFSHSHKGACSHHGGVKEYTPAPPTAEAPS